MLITQHINDAGDRAKSSHSQNRGILPAKTTPLPSTMWRWYGKIELQFHFIKDINMLSETVTALLDNS